MPYVDISTWTGGTRWTALWNGESANELGITAGDFCSRFTRRFCNLFCGQNNNRRRCGFCNLGGGNNNNNGTRACCLACVRIAPDICQEVFAARANVIDFCECFSADFCTRFVDAYIEERNLPEACRGVLCARCCAASRVACREVLRELGANASCCF